MAEDRDDVVGHPDLASASAAMRDAWRAEQEAAGGDAAEQWRHGRSLNDRLVECMHRGDPVAAVVAGHRLAGEVVEVCDDLLSLLTVAGRVDVNLCDEVPVALEVVERVRTGGRCAAGSSGGFRSRMLSREAEDVEVTVVTAFLPEPLDGKVSVGADYICVTGSGGEESFLAMSSVAFVSPRRR